MPLIEKPTRERKTVLSGQYDEIDDLVRIDCMLRDWMGGWARKTRSVCKKRTVGSTQGALHDYYSSPPPPGPGL